jgi:hypothetical protein
MGADINEDPGFRCISQWRGPESEPGLVYGGGQAGVSMEAELSEVEGAAAAFNDSKRGQGAQNLAKPFQGFKRKRGGWR